MPTRTPPPSSRSAVPASYVTLPATMPSWLAATASMKTTIGVAMPSFRPLSTFSALRSRPGMRSSSITWTLRAASVGASAAPMKPASAHGNPLKSQPASRPPRSTDRRSPMLSNLVGTARSRRSSATFTRAASENSTSARVTSATMWIDAVSTLTVSGPQSGLARR